MNPVTHPVYKDYPEQPYISPQRDLAEWIAYPERFPYGVVEKKQMQRLPEGLLPGHVVMLWRVNFGNITNETIMPQYFEYRYGVDSAEALDTLIKLGYIRRCNARESLDMMNMVQLKRLLKQNGLPEKGKKQELLERAFAMLAEETVGQQVAMRKYQITPTGQVLLKKYDDIVQKHGPKM